MVDQPRKRNEAIQQAAERWKDAANFYRMADELRRGGNIEGSIKFVSIAEEAEAEACMIEQGLK